MKGNARSLSSSVTSLPVTMSNRFAFSIKGSVSSGSNGNTG